MIDRSGRKLLLCFYMVKLCGKAYGLFSGKNSPNQGKRKQNFKYYETYWKRGKNVI